MLEITTEGFWGGRVKDIFLNLEMPDINLTVQDELDVLITLEDEFSIIVEDES